MATLIFVDKENGEPGTRVAPKDALKPVSRPCKYTGCNPSHIVTQLWACLGVGEAFSVLGWQFELGITEYHYCNVLVMVPFSRSVPQII